MYVSKKIVYCVIDSIVVGEKVKPVQEAIRRVFYRYRVSDELLFKKLSGLLYNVFRSYGLVDYIVWRTTGVDVYGLSVIERGILRAIGYVWFLDRVLDDRQRVRFYKYTLKYISERYRRGVSRLDRIVEKMVSSKWMPSSFYEEIMFRYRVSIELYKALEKASKELGFNLEELLEYTLKPPPYHVLRVNTLKASLNAILKYLLDQGVRVKKGRYSGRALRVYGSLSNEVIKLIETGILVPQDESSIVAIELLPLREGLEIADLCAAPGGKTSLLVEITKCRSRVYAFDINRDRVKRMRLLLERTGTIDAVMIYNMDARRSVEVLGRNSIDIAVVDPPCSSTGALARNPDVRWRYRESEIRGIIELQKQLLETAYEIVKKGGYILYTTCSLLPCEGEYVIRHVIERHSDLELIPLNKPFNKSPLIPEAMRAYPHIHGVTGFFYTLLKKR